MEYLSPPQDHLQPVHQGPTACLPHTDKLLRQSTKESKWLPRTKTPLIYKVLFPKWLPIFGSNDAREYPQRLQHLRQPALQWRIAAVRHPIDAKPFRCTMRKFRCKKRRHVPARLNWRGSTRKKWNRLRRSAWKFCQNEQEKTRTK